MSEVSSSGTCEAFLQLQGVRRISLLMVVALAFSPLTAAAVAIPVRPPVCSPDRTPVVAATGPVLVPAGSPVPVSPAPTDTVPQDTASQDTVPQDTAPHTAVTLAAAIHSALRHHPTLAVAGAVVDRAAAGSREASAARLPTLSTDASFMRFAEPMVTAPLHGFNPLQPPVFDRTLFQGGISLGYTLFDGGAREARRARAEALTAAGEAGVAGARTALLGEVVRAFLRVLTAGEVLEANERRVAALAGERERAAQLLEQGTAARVQVLRAEAAHGAARAEWYAARGEREVAVGDLARLTGLDPARLTSLALVPVRLAGSAAPALDRGALLAQALASNPELTQLQSLAEAAEATRGEARSLWFPTVRAVGHYGEYASALGREQGEWQGGLQLSFPLFTGGARQAVGDRAAAESRSARAEFELAKLALAAGLDRALAAVEAEQARAEALRTAAAQAEEVARIEALALAAGAGIQIDYLSAEAELLRVRAAWSAARAAEIGARVELARVVGELSVEWLELKLESGS
jgi:outer membrane protein TolC